MPSWVRENALLTFVLTIASFFLYRTVDQLDKNTTELTQIKERLAVIETKLEGGSPKAKQNADAVYGNMPMLPISNSNHKLPRQHYTPWIKQNRNHVWIQRSS